MLWLVFWGGILGSVGGSERLGALGECGVLVLWAFVVVVSLSSLISMFSLDLSSVTDVLHLSLGALVSLGSKVI